MNGNQKYGQGTTSAEGSKSGKAGISDLCKQASEMMSGRIARLAVYSSLFVVMVIINVAIALAQSQGHPLSQVNVDKNLVMGSYQISAAGLNLTPSFAWCNLETNAAGQIYCGSDDVNDADANPTNEAQTLSSVVSGGNNYAQLSQVSGVGGGTVTCQQLTGGAGLCDSVDNVDDAVASCTNVYGCSSPTNAFCTGITGHNCGFDNGITSSGSATYIPVFTSGTNIGNSAIYQSGTNIGIGTTSPASKLSVNTNGAASVTLYSSGGTYALYGDGATYGLYASGSSFGVYGQSNSGTGVYGTAISGVYGVHGVGGTYAVYGESGSHYGYLGSGSYGGYAYYDASNYAFLASSSIGVYGQGSSYGISGVGGSFGVYSNGNTGIYSAGTGGPGIDATSSSNNGAQGRTGSQATSNMGAGVAGFGDTYGVYGKAYNGVFGQGTGSGYGVVGTCSGAGTSCYGVQGYGPGSGGNIAGYFSGNVYVTGNLGAGGTKPFIIDHPTSPKTKVLRHNSAESSEMLDMYKGNNVTIGRHRNIMMPDWFVPLNGNLTSDYSFAITPLNGFCGQYYVNTSRIAVDGSFTVVTEVDCEFSWVVYAVRHDAYARNYPLIVEEEKAAAGFKTDCYLNPSLFGASEGGPEDCNVKEEKKS